MEEWVRDLRAGRFDTAWDHFISQYRRLLFAAIRHYVRDHDEVMDAFAKVCEGLHEGDMRRLRAYVEAPSHRASFPTWLVTVARNLTVDWLRQRHGRSRPSDLPEDWSPLRRRIFELVFMARHSHLEAYGQICAANPPGPSFREFLAEVRATYHVAGDGRSGRGFRELFPAQLELEPGTVHPPVGGLRPVGSHQEFRSRPGLRLDGLPLYRGPLDPAEPSHIQGHIQGYVADRAQRRFAGCGADGRDHAVHQPR